MKTNLIRRTAIALCMVSCLTVISCKKDQSASGDNTSANLTTDGDDQEQVSSESDMISNDVSAALSAQADFSGLSSSSIHSGNIEINSAGPQTQVLGLINDHQAICDATITYDTADGQKRATIVYDGSNCWGNRTRNGTIIISLPIGEHWKDAGAVATITIVDLKIGRVRDHKNIVLNGTKTITNVSGGLLIDLATEQIITHTITGTLSITFENGNTRNWNVAKSRTFTYDNGIAILTTGTHSDGTNSDIAEWGTNRFGESFINRISAPIIIRQDCDFRIVSGQHTHILEKGIAVITYGLDASGEATGCPGTGNYYFKLVFTGVNGKSYTIIWPY